MGTRTGSLMGMMCRSGGLAERQGSRLEIGRRETGVGSTPTPSANSVTVTTTQHDVLVALVRYGTMKRAAHSLGITGSAFAHRMRKVRKRTGLTTVQLTHRLGAGQVLIQDGFWLEAA